MWLIVPSVLVLPHLQTKSNWGIMVDLESWPYSNPPLMYTVALS